MRILVLNAGSSSQKCSLFEVGAALPDAAPRPLWEAQADGGKVSIFNAAGAKLNENLADSSPSASIPRIIETIWSGPAKVCLLYTSPSPRDS